MLGIIYWDILPNVHGCLTLRYYTPKMNTNFDISLSFRSILLISFLWEMDSCFIYDCLNIAIKSFYHISESLKYIFSVYQSFYPASSTLYLSVFNCAMNLILDPGFSSDLVTYRHILTFTVYCIRKPSIKKLPIWRKSQITVCGGMILQVNI